MSRGMAVFTREKGVYKGNASPDVEADVDGRVCRGIRLLEKEEKIWRKITYWL